MWSVDIREFEKTTTVTSCRTPPNNSNNREFGQTTTATSCRTPPNNGDNREFKKTTTATSCRTPPNNSVNEQNNETAHAKKNLIGFSSPSSARQRQMIFSKFGRVLSELCDVKLSMKNSEKNNKGKTPTVLKVGRLMQENCS